MDGSYTYVFVQFYTFLLSSATDIECDTAAQTQWTNAVFAMEQVAESITIIHDALGDFICPDDGLLNVASAMVALMELN